MARTVFYTATSLDGFIAAPGHSLDWLLSREGGNTGEYGYESFIDGIGALVMGANTYRWLHAQARAEGQADPQWTYTQPTWVVSRAGVPAWEGAALQVTDAPIPQVHAAMTEAADGGDLWIVGGGDLAGQFHDHRLLDEVVVSIAPVTLGAGAPLLPRHVELRLRASEQSGEFLVAAFDVVH